MVRQFSRSAIRDCAVCRIGALWPSSRPATTTAITPEAWISSDSAKAANGTTSDMPLSSTGSVEVAAHLGHHEEERQPDHHAAARGQQEVEPDVRDARGARPRPAPSAVPSATSAVASLKQRLALEDRDDPPRQPDPAPDRRRRDRVRRRHHGADRERHRPGLIRQQQVRDDAHAAAS